MATVRDLDTRLDEQDRAFAEFRGEVRTLIMLGKWLAAFSAVAIFGMVAQVFAVARTAGNLESQVAIQGQEIMRLRDKTDQLGKDMARVEQKVDGVTDLLKQLQADLRRDRPAKP